MSEPQDLAQRVETMLDEVKQSTADIDRLIEEVRRDRQYANQSSRMDGEQKAWVAAAFAGVLVILGIAGGITYSTVQGGKSDLIKQQQQNDANNQVNQRINDCVANGKDPVLCRVAITGTNK